MQGQFTHIHMLGLWEDVTTEPLQTRGGRAHPIRKSVAITWPFSAFVIMVVFEFGRHIH